MKRKAWAAVAAVLVLGASACGGANDGASSGGGDELRFGYTIPAMTMDPHNSPTDVGQYPFTSLVYDRLTQIVEGPAVAPMLAAEWQFAADGLSAVFTLRDDVTFSDGAKLDASAVKVSLDRALTDPKSTAKGRFGMIKAITVVDDKHVRIETNRKADDLPYVLAGSYGSIISPKAIGNNDLDLHPVGSGPYVLGELKMGDRAVFTKRDDYWDKDAGRAKVIEIIGLPDDNARLNALRSGQIDIALIKLGQSEQAQSLGNDFGFHSFPPASTYALSINTSRPSVADVKVRQAINFALDRDGMNDSLLNGQCDPNPQPLTEGFEGYVDAPEPMYSYDPARAKKLLSEAGVNGKLSVNLIVPPALAPQNKMGEAIQARLEAVGIKVKRVDIDHVQAPGDFAKGGYDLFIQTRQAGPTAAMTLASGFLNPALNPGAAPAQLKTDLDRALDPALTDEARAQVLEAASNLIVDNALEGFICAVPTQVAYVAGVKGIEEMGVSYFQGVPDLRNVGFES